MAKHPKLASIALEAGTLLWNHKENLDATVLFEEQTGTVTIGQKDVCNI